MAAATGASRNAAIMAQPAAWQTHHAAEPSYIASASMMRTNGATGSSAPPWARGSARRNSLSPCSAAIAVPVRRRAVSDAGASASRTGPMASIRARHAASPAGQARSCTGTGASFIGALWDATRDVSPGGLALVYASGAVQASKP